MPHLLLQLLVDPEASEDGKVLRTAQAGQTQINEPGP